MVTSTVGWSDTTFFMQETEEYWRRDHRHQSDGGDPPAAAAALGPMIEQKSGSIVLTSSDAGKVGTMGETVYAAAKAGVIGFVKSLAREIARDGLRINAISPGPTDTPLLRAQSDQHVIDKMIRAVPLKRMGPADEQAAADRVPGLRRRQLHHRPDAQCQWWSHHDFMTEHHESCSPDSTSGSRCPQTKDGARSPAWRRRSATHVRPARRRARRPTRTPAPTPLCWSWPGPSPAPTRSSRWSRRAS